MGQSITAFFGDNLAQLLGDRIEKEYTRFDIKQFVAYVRERKDGKTYTERIKLIAEALHEFLPKDYETSVRILMSILGPENTKETGMFTHFYWIMPIGAFVQMYGLNHFDLSMKAIEEITKRNTGEYAVRPFIQTYPKESLTILKNGQSQIIFM